MNNQTYQNFKLEIDEEQILWLYFDRADAKVNSLDITVFDELSSILDEVSKQSLNGLVILSAKPRGFIAGADIKQFIHVKTEQDAFDLIRPAQLVLDKLEALPIPTVALIKGFCLGGGTELALACRYRIAEEGASTRIGLPEIKLGIHPGWGGTVRLPKLIGILPAMQMILPGAAYSAYRCKKLGIVDAVVPERELLRAARWYIQHQPKAHQPKAWTKCLEISFVRSWLGKLFYKNLKKKHVNREHYPAPYAVVDNWVEIGVNSDKAMETEANSIAKMMVTDTARHLVQLFFLSERLKGIGKTTKIEVEHVHVIGAGTMGGDIAAWSALKGFHVTLQDMSPEQIAPAIKRAYSLFKKKLKKPRLIQAAMDRLQPDIQGLGVKRADVIIEAIFEDLEVKQNLFKDLESKAKKQAILASNTSSIPLEEIAEVLTSPDRLVGIHFFNPVAKMPLVEVVQGQKTAKNIVDQAAAFAGKLGRFPLPVQSRPGFLVNRMLMPYLMEAMLLLDEGVPAAVIDKAALQFGMPMGPLTLADKVGLDVAVSVAESLSQHFGGEIPQCLQTLFDEKHFGVKTGRGFYQYDKQGKKIKPKQDDEVTRVPDIKDRLILSMLNEGAACLHEKVVEDSDLIDAGMVFGTGFAPFRGGPMAYVKDYGVVEIVKRLEVLAQQYGERFRPRAGWAQFAKMAQQVEPENKSGNGAELSDKTEIIEKAKNNLSNPEIRADG